MTPLLFANNHGDVLLGDVVPPGQHSLSDDPRFVFFADFLYYFGGKFRCPLMFSTRDSLWMSPRAVAVS